jgi:hypothetical protein
MGNAMSNDVTTKKVFFHELEIIPGFNQQVSDIINRYLDFSKLSKYSSKKVYCTIEGEVYFKDDKLHRVRECIGPQESAVKINCEYSGYDFDTYIFNIELCYKEGVLHSNYGYAVYVPGTAFGEYWRDGVMVK